MSERSLICQSLKMLLAGFLEQLISRLLQVSDGSNLIIDFKYFCTMWHQLYNESIVSSKTSSNPTNRCMYSHLQIDIHISVLKRIILVVFLRW